MLTQQTRMSAADFRQMVASGQIQSVRVKRASPEEDLHRSCMEWVKFSTARHPVFKWLVHVPNGGKRPKGEAGKLKAMGTKPGYPDLTIPRRRAGWYGLAIELKSPTGRVSEDQQDWLTAFSEDGWLVAVCRTVEEFIAAVNVYLEGSESASLPTVWRPARP